MRWGRGAAIVAFCLCESGSAHALDPTRSTSQYAARAFGEEEGLPQPSVHAVAQEGDGYLWVGTDGGLARFDGVSFTVFDATNTPALQVPRVRTLLPDGHGDLWIGTTGSTAGLIRHRAGKFEAMSSRAGLEGGAVLSSLRTSAGDLWFGGWRGVSRWRDGAFRPFTSAHGLPSIAAWAFAEADQTLFVGTHLGLYRLSGERFARDERLPDPQIPVRSLWADGDGTLWAGTAAGVVRIPPRGAVAVLDERHGLPSPDVRAIRRDRDGNLWVGTTLGLARLRGEAFDVVPSPAGAGRSVEAILEDREGNLWVGARAGGLVRMTDGRFTTWTTVQGLPSNLIIAVHVGRDGAIWIGTNGAGLVRMHQGRVSRYTRRTGACVDVVMALAEDRSGGLWVGGSDGASGNLCRWQDERFTTFAGWSQSSQAAVRALFEDEAGTLWVGAEGLFRREGERFERVQAELRGNVYQLQQDDRGALWVAAGDGVWRFAEGRWSRFGTDQGLPTRAVFSVRQDDDGTLWVGTGRGLARWDGSRFVSLVPALGIDEPVYGIVDGGDGGLWFSGPRGVVRAKKSVLRDAGTGAVPFRRFGRSDGLASSEGAGGEGNAAVTRAPDGRLWFATSGGVSSVDPVRPGPSRPAPPVRVQALVADGVRHDTWVDAQIPPGARTLEIGYAGLSFTAPEKVLFRYRLAPFDDGWVDAGPRRTAYYTRLPPGTYEFQVQARHDDGSWDQQRTSLRFHLRPFFHQTETFRWLVGGGVVALILGAHRLRMRQERARHHAVLQERTRIARDMHDTLAQGFAGISLHIEGACKRLPSAPDRALESLEHARFLVRTSLAEARRAVWGLRAQALEGHDLATAIAAEMEKLGAGTLLRFRVGGTVRPVPASLEQVILRAAQESVTNAIKHARASRIELDLTYAPEALELRVQDDGVGFDPQMTGEGAGRFGLRGVRERVAAAGGDLTIRSQPGQGTEIALRLPLAAVS